MSVSSRFGEARSPAQVSSMLACEELITGFCDLMDAGAVEEALDLHGPDAAFYDLDGAEIRGRQAIAAWLGRVRLRDPGRSTLHVPSNFRFSEVADGFAECRVVITIFELIEGKADGPPRPWRPELRGVIAETISFRRSNGRWRFETRRLCLPQGGAKATCEVEGAGQ